MFSRQYESMSIKLYYSMSTISYTPRFPYHFKMTMIECSRIPKDRDRSLAEATRGRRDSMLTSSHASRRDLRRSTEYAGFPCIIECLTKFIVLAVFFYLGSIKLSKLFYILTRDKQLGKGSGISGIPDGHVPDSGAPRILLPTSQSTTGSNKLRRTSLLVSFRLNLKLYMIPK